MKYKYQIKSDLLYVGWDGSTKWLPQPGLRVIRFTIGSLLPDFFKDRYVVSHFQNRLTYGSGSTVI